MIRCTLAAEDIAATQFAVSPIHECVFSFRAVHGKAGHPLFGSWLRATRRTLGSRRFPLLTATLCNDTGYIPDFLAPVPSTASPRFDDELDEMARTPAAVVADELARTYAWPRLPALIVEGRKNPDRFLRGAARELADFWECSIAPAWPRLRAMLESEVAFRARDMAAHGAGVMLNRLHTSVQYTNGALALDKPDERQFDTRGLGFVLVPSVFAWPNILVTASDNWRPSIAYPARGLGTLWDGAEPSSRDALASLLGHQRAAVLAAVCVPRTTLDVAARLRITPGAASRHLSRLRAAGVLDRSRSGRYVLYSANERGRRVIAATTPTGPTA